MTKIAANSSDWLRTVTAFASVVGSICLGLLTYIALDWRGDTEALSKEVKALADAGAEIAKINERVVVRLGFIEGRQDRQGSRMDDLGKNVGELWRSIGRGPQ